MEEEKDYLERERMLDFTPFLGREVNDIEKQYNQIKRKYISFTEHHLIKYFPRIKIRPKPKKLYLEREDENEIEKIQDQLNSIADYCITLKRRKLNSKIAEINMDIRDFLKRLRKVK